MIDRIFGPLARRWKWVDTALRTQKRFSEVHGNFLASSITLTAFLSLFPLLLVVIAVLGFFSVRNSNVASDIISNLGLSGDAAKAVTSAIEKAERSRRTAAPIGLAGLFWSGLGLVAALQFAFDSVWQVTGRGLKDKAWGLAWLAGAGLILAGSVALTAVLNFVPGVAAPLVFLGGFVVDVGLFLWTLNVLPNRNVGWRPLLPGAVLGAAGLEILKAVGAIYVPRIVASSSALYGSIGTIFAILAWLLFFGRLVVYAAVLNVVRWEEDHGTVTAEIEIPKLPGEVPVTATRAGEAQETPAN